MTQDETKKQVLRHNIKRLIEHLETLAEWQDEHSWLQATEAMLFVWPDASDGVQDLLTELRIELGVNEYGEPLTSDGDVDYNAPDRRWIDPLTDEVAA